MARKSNGEDEDRTYSHRYDVHYDVTNFHWGIIQRMISKIKNHYHDSESAVHVRAHEAGLTFLCQQVDEELKSEGTVDSDLQELIDAKAEVDKIIHDDAITSFYHTMYKRRGAEYLIDYCAKHGTDPERYLKEFRLGAKEQSWAEKAEAWINKTLALYPNGCEIAFIRERAINDGLLPNPTLDPNEFERRWRQLRVLASVMGITSYSARGVWKLNASMQG